MKEKEMIHLSLLKEYTDKFAGKWKKEQTYEEFLEEKIIELREQLKEQEK